MFVAAFAALALRAVLASAATLQGADSTPYVPLGASDSVLAAIAAHEPDSLRSALSTTRASVVRAESDAARETALAFATRLARAYAAVWSDSFFVREIGRFNAEPAAWRGHWVTADSLRRAGVAAVSRAGTPTAMRLWRRSLREFRALADTAGMAAATGNIGAGFYLQGDLDSAAVYLDRGLRLATAVDDRRTEANAVGTLASVHKDRGELREARVMYERALVLRQRSGDRRGAAADRNNLGLIDQSLGDLNSARVAFGAALADNRSAGRQHSVAINLTNLATLASLTGDSPRADSLYRMALAIHSDLGERDDEAVVLHDVALLQMRRADYDGALASLQRALALTDSTGAQQEHLAELSDLAALQAARGGVEEGISTLRDAERRAVSMNAPDALLARLALARGELDVALNALADAERDYARAARFAAAAGDRGLQADAELGRGILLTERDRYDAAIAAIAASMRNHQAVGDRRAAAMSGIWLGYAQSRKGDTSRARRSLSSARAEMRAVGDPAGEAAALASLGDFELQIGAPLAAESAFRIGLVAAGARPSPDVAWRLHAGLGSVLRARGTLAEASAELQIAITYIERSAGRLRLGEQREGYHADKWDVYATLAFTEQQRGRPGDAFSVSERLRARQALDMMNPGTIRYVAATDSTAVREQELRHRIAELTRIVAGDEREVASLRGTAGDAPARDAARESLAELEREYAALVLELREQDPGSVRVANTAPSSAREVSAQLTPDEVLLEYLITDSAATVFVLTSDTVAAVDLDLGRHELASLVDYTRDAIARPSARGSESWRAPLQRLYRLLIQPAEETGLLRGRRHLIIVPHAELHFLPFGALMPPGEGDHFLIERATIVTAPRASLWLRLTRRAIRQPEGGMLALAPRADVLPASRLEVDGIGGIYGPRATILRDVHASRAAFAAGAPGSAVVHLASLGVLNKHNPLFSFVELAPEGADDGRLAVTDVLGMRLNARLVTLSACQTALGAGALADVPAGDEWVGFTSAFLRAGARDVLATLWPVEDDATATLMTAFYRRFEANTPAADALAEAQREAIHDGARAAPFHWAGFVLTGAR